MPVAMMRDSHGLLNSHHLATAVAALWLFAALVVKAHAQEMAAAVVSLEVKADQELTRVWTVSQAELEEHFAWTLGTLKVQNISRKPTADLGAYAEYFDASDRLCLMLAFAQGRNYERRTGSFKPGEIRTLSAGASYLSPAVKPVRVEVRLLSGPMPKDAKGRLIAALGITSPVTLESSALTGEEWEKVWLVPEITGVSSPFLDLLLAKVRIGSGGEVEETEIVKAGNDSSRSWFERFIGHQRFLPATRDSEAVDSEILVLPRAVVSLRCLHQKAWPPRNSTLVRQYIDTLPSDAVVPPVITLLLRPISSSYFEHPSPGYFEELGIGTDWGVVENPDAERHSLPGPILPRIVPPAGSDTCP